MYADPKHIAVSDRATGRVGLVDLFRRAQALLVAQTGEVQMADLVGYVDVRVLHGLAESWAQAAGSTLELWPTGQLAAADLVSAKDAGLLACALALRAACMAEAEKSMGQVVITLLPDERVRMLSTCFGRPDCSYLSLADAKAGGEVTKLVQEMRQRLGGVNPL